MASQLGQIGELYERILVAKAACADAFTVLERDTFALLIEARDQERRGWLRTGVAGMPCASPQLEAAPDVYIQPADASDSSATIPPEVVDRIARGGE